MAAWRSASFPGQAFQGRVMPKTISDLPLIPDAMTVTLPAALLNGRTFTANVNMTLSVAGRDLPLTMEIRANRRSHTSGSRAF
jgi:hypothetical protein